MDKFKMKIVKVLKIQKKCSGDSFQVLPNNRLDKDVQRIVCSFNVALGVFFNTKYNVQNHHIYSNGIKYRMFSFSCMLIMNLSCIYRIVATDIRDVNKNMSSTEEDFFSLFVTIYYILFMVGFTLSFILDNVLKDHNVLLVLMIQSLNKSIDLSKGIMGVVVWNWISILTIIFIDSFTILLYYATCFYPNVIDMILDIAVNTLFFGLEINLAIGTRIIILLRNYLYEWIKEILNMNDDHENKEQCLKLLDVYQNIIKAYNLYKRIFQVLVSICEFTHTKTTHDK